MGALNKKKTHLSSLVDGATTYGPLAALCCILRLCLYVYKVFYDAFLSFRGGAFGNKGVHLCAQGVLAHPPNP